MTRTRDLGFPEHLSTARTNAHAATQLLYRAAVANNSPRPGDEHSNLGWDTDSELFQTRPLAGTDAVVTLRLSPLELAFAGATNKLDGKTPGNAMEWLDAELVRAGLNPGSGVEVTYDLPDEVSKLERFSDVAALAHLSAWFDLAARALSKLALDLSNLLPGPSEVRCWPHHFDIATYVSLENGDPEEARGVGVGMSPGDGSYNQPYFYVNAWPHLDPDTLPAPIPPGHWHTDDFVGSIATGKEICSMGDARATVQAFLSHSFRASLAALRF